MDTIDIYTITVIFIKKPILRFYLSEWIVNFLSYIANSTVVIIHHNLINVTKLWRSKSDDTLSLLLVTKRFLCWQSEHIGQCATPHHRRLGGIGRVHV